MKKFEKVEGTQKGNQKKDGTVSSRVPNKGWSNQTVKGTSKRPSEDENRVVTSAKKTGGSPNS